jgi:hypothetical protein
MLPADSLENWLYVFVWNKAACAVTVDAQMQAVWTPFYFAPFGGGFFRCAHDIDFTNSAGHEKLGLAAADVHAQSDGFAIHVRFQKYMSTQSGFVELAIAPEECNAVFQCHHFFAFSKDGAGAVPDHQADECYQDEFR